MPMSTVFPESSSTAAPLEHIVASPFVNSLIVSLNQPRIWPRCSNGGMALSLILSKHWDTQSPVEFGCLPKNNLYKPTNPVPLT